MSEQTEVSFDTALMMAIHADAQKELNELPTPAQLKERYPDTSRWDARLQAALHKRRPVLKRVLARPIAALLVAKIEVIYQQVGQRGLLRLFQSVQKKLLLFVQVCDPALQPTNCAADGLHQTIGCTNIPIEISEKGFDSSLLHLVSSGAEMHGRNLLHSLPLE